MIAKPQGNFWKRMAADWKPTLLVASPMFALAMWAGISRGYKDIGLYAIVMALGTLHVAELAVGTFRRFREWRGRGRRNAYREQR